MSITDWVRRAFVANALVPLLLVEIALVAAYLVTNNLAHERHVETLKNHSFERLLSSTQQQATLIGEKLQRAADDTGQFARHLSLALRYPARRNLDAHKAIRRSPEGALYTEKDTGGFAIFYSGIQPIGIPEIQKLQRLLRVDPVMQGILERHAEVAQIYFNTHDSLNIIYPYFDVLSQYPPKMDIPSYNFYYAADAEHNPERKPVWTDVYVDPAGKGWMTSCIAPVYRGDFLEGVAGMDITVNSIVEQLQKLQVPWKGYMVLMGSDGTLMALPPEGETDWGIRELTSHHYDQAIRQDTFKPGQFNILKRTGDETWGKEVLEHESGTRLVQLNGDKLIAWSTVPHTHWKLLTLAPTSEVFSTADRLREDIGNVGKLMVIGLVVFYLVFFAILARRARYVAKRLSQPLLEISDIAREIGEGKFDHQPPLTPLQEMQDTGNSLIHMGHRLKVEIGARERAEQRLHNSYDEIEHQIMERTRELEAEIRERKRLEGALRIQAEYDALTGLPNRQLFYDRAQQALALARRNKSPIAVMFIDLDNFKPINDSLGHRAGDELLREVAARLHSCVRASDTVCRFGGDEFVVLLIDFDPGEDPENIARTIIDRLSSPIDLSRQEQEVMVSGSIGIAMFPDDGDSVDELLHQADAAMYRAKEVGKNAFRFAAERH